MDGVGSPENRDISVVKDRPLIQPVASRKELIASLLKSGGGEGGAILQNHRYLIDREKKNFYIVEAIHDEDDPHRNEVQHRDIAVKLKGGKIDDIDDFVGGYVWIEEDPEEGYVFYNTGHATSIEGIDNNDEFQRLFLDIKDDDPEAPHFFILDKTYGKVGSTK